MRLAGSGEERGTEGFSTGGIDVVGSADSEGSRSWNDLMNRYHDLDRDRCVERSCDT